MTEKPKILYAIQGTGNGHVARAREIVPILQKRYEVHILLSGNQSEVNLPFKVHYYCKGLVMLYGKKGGVSFTKTLLKTNLFNLLKEVLQLPVKQYDLVVNDFEFVSAWACRLRGKKSLGAGHQASFISKKVPLPNKKDVLGSLVLKHYAPATYYLGYHFKAYDSFIKTPVVRTEIRSSTPTKQPHYTVYLPAYADEEIFKVLSGLEGTQWHVFSKRCTTKRQQKNVLFHPVSNQDFIESFLNCSGILTSAGFETPAEALYLSKKLFVIPIKNQYEQYCNAEALKEMGVMCAYTLNANTKSALSKWINQSESIHVAYKDTTASDLYAFIDLHLNPFPNPSNFSTISN